MGNVTSSTKPEVQIRQRRTESRIANVYKNLVKFVHVLRKICSRNDRQTGHQQTSSSQYWALLLGAE